VRVFDEVCLGHCLRGPNVLVEEEAASSEPALGGQGRAPTPGGEAVLYDRMTVADLDRVLERHLAGGMAIRVLTHRPPVPGR
jgi:(2Fe-2S) ferredoxin